MSVAKKSKAWTRSPWRVSVRSRWWCRVALVGWLRSSQDRLPTIIAAVDRGLARLGCPGDGELVVDRPAEARALAASRRGQVGRKDP